MQIYMGRGGEMQRRRGGGGREPEEMYNREDVEGTNG